MSLKFISPSDFSYKLRWWKFGLWMKRDFSLKKHLLSVEIFVSWGWKMKFLKTKTYLFAYIASETHGDYISVVLFVLVGCALQGKMQLSNESWYDIVIVHHLMEITAQIQRACLDSMLCSCFTHAVRRTEHRDSVSETTSLHFSWF